jgi:RNA polymerase sigma-70 factor, ECF subfamily
MSMNIRNDTELWQMVRQGERAAYEMLYRRYMRALYVAIYKWTDNRADAEDILQDVFLGIWEKRQQIVIQQEIFTYFYTATRYKVFDYLKNKKLSERQLNAWNEMPEDMITNMAFRLDRSEERDILLDKEIAQLPPQMKQVYNLRFKENKSIQEIANELFVSPYTVKNHLQKIRKRLYASTLRPHSLFISFLIWLISCL